MYLVITSLISDVRCFVERI